MSEVVNKLPTTAVDLSLIETQYRSAPLHAFFVGLNERISMLHPDVLAVLYHFGAHVGAPILELGPYVGGSTIAIAKGLESTGQSCKVTTIEIGGQYDHPTYATTDIVASLRMNLAKHGIADRVNLIVGNSRDAAVVEQVRTIAASGRFGCMVIDTDGQVEQDIDLYRTLLEPRAYLVVDDYYAPGAPEKEATTRTQMDRMIQDGIVESFGVHGWGTWIGRFV